MKCPIPERGSGISPLSVLSLGGKAGGAPKGKVDRSGNHRNSVREFEKVKKSVGRKKSESRSAYEMGMEILGWAAFAGIMAVNVAFIVLGIMGYDIEVIRL